MIATFFVGYIFDILGRKLTLFFAFALTSIMMFFIPRMSPVVFPNLLLLRTGIAITIVPPVSNPLIGDYLMKESIGKGAALMGIGFILGEIFSMGVLFNVTKHMSPDMAFMTVSIIGGCIAILFLFIVKEPQLRSKEKEISREEALEQGIRRISTV